jgi:hypothetical protein
MKIGIFGDSFSGGVGPTSWTTLLHTEFGNTINHSELGTSLFHAYQHFIKNNREKKQPFGNDNLPKLIDDIINYRPKS